VLVLAVLFLLSADPSAGLLNSSARGQTDQVKVLLDSGANIEAKDKRGRTPLILAAQHGQVETVRLLLAKGADVNARDRDGWTAYGLILLSPAGDLFRKHQEEVLSLLPKPAPWRVAVESTWSPETLFSSCNLGRDQLPQFVRDLRLDDLALAAFQSEVNTAANGILQIAHDDADAKLTLMVKPGATCAQQTGDTLNLSIDATLVRSSNQASLFKNTYGGGLKGLHVRGVGNPSQYMSIYEGWIKTHSAKIYHDVLADLLKSPR
jgi:hypothetical protein